MCSMLNNAIQCTSCAMYAILEQLFEGEYCCTKCVQVADLEAQILDLNRQLVTVRGINPFPLLDVPGTSSLLAQNARGRTRYVLQMARAQELCPCHRQQGSAVTYS